MRSTSLPSHASGRESLCVPSPATGLRAASLQSERTRLRLVYGSLRLAARPPRRNPGNQEEGLSPWLRERMMLRAFPLLEGPDKARAAL